MRSNPRLNTIESKCSRLKKKISGREGSILGSDKTIITCNVIIEG